MKDAIARLRCPGGTGTAWLCSREYALTAAHCVEVLQHDPSGRAIPQGLPYEPTELILEFPWRTENQVRVVQVERFDRGLDVALLRVPAGVIPKDIEPIPIAALPTRNPWPTGPTAIRWSAFGFPRRHGEGLSLTGSITDPEGRVGNYPAIQLYCDQGGLGDLNGSSGAAICCGGVAVGLIRYGTLSQKVVFAVSVTKIAATFPEIERVLAGSAARCVWNRELIMQEQPLSPGAAEIWKQKREYFQQQLLLTASADQKFELIQGIAEADRHLQGQRGILNALDLWQEKLKFFQEQEAITSAPAQKFALKMQIEEASQKIREFSP